MTSTPHPASRPIAHPQNQYNSNRYYHPQKNCKQYPSTDRQSGTPIGKQKFPTAAVDGSDEHEPFDHQLNQAVSCHQTAIVAVNSNPIVLSKHGVTTRDFGDNYTGSEDIELRQTRPSP